MANANRPNGLTAVKHLISGDFNGQGNLYWIPAADTNGYAVGDPVATIANADNFGTPGITLATAGTGNAIRGVILGLGTLNAGGLNVAPESALFNVLNLNTTVRPSGAQATDYYALVADDPNIIYEVQEIGTGTPLTATAVNNNANLVAGTNNGFASGWQLNNVGVATTATLQVRILGLARRTDNTFGQYQKWLVKINNHELAAGTAGI